MTEQTRWIVGIGVVVILVTAACGDDAPTAPTAPTTPGAATNRAPVAVGQIPDQVVNLGESTTLDVAQYFNDPDGDRLTYSAMVNNVGAAVSVEASIVTITGNSPGSVSQIAVSARDVHGASAEQPFTAYVHLPDGTPAYRLIIEIGDWALLTSDDPTSLQGVTYAGRGERSPFGKGAVNAYLFDVQYGNVEIEYQVNPEFGSREAARAQVDTYAVELGRLPAVLLSKAEVVVIQTAGSTPGGHPYIGFEIPTGRSETLISWGRLEEELLWVGTWVSLYDHLNAPGWRAAKEADGGFISTYARDSELGDVAESFVAYFAVRYLPERITATDRGKIQATIPNRLAYFDEQRFDMSPYRR